MQRHHHFLRLFVALSCLVHEERIIAPCDIAAGGTRVYIVVLHPSLVELGTNLHAVPLFQFREHRLHAETIG